MNRTIKFRGKTYSGNLVYGDLVLPPNRFASIRENRFTTDMPKYEENQVIPETVGQFTGLCDKNGKEIYEHDYVSIIYKYESIGTNGGVIPDQDCICKGEVVFMNEFSCFGLRLYKAEYPIKKSLDGCPYLTIPMLQFDLECDSIEVLGNVFDNLELIDS